ncbi:hypothetical protein JDV02_003849 [Purpureocillium takamizusanense]|uniref:Transcriptional regulator n=1 Tax=Purpureocillium takamizusanense TaxID=2060973 RepID=A0A9Q8VA47_9HYPO|nr:uncharacterized protein JDV02_003849 [Purpureocillium takamizusanense]UNI17509.1 hypothetical protein JDV02_003849 [Purpureocillium takamizusanense]
MDPPARSCGHGSACDSSFIAARHDAVSYPTHRDTPRSSTRPDPRRCRPVDRTAAMAPPPKEELEKALVAGTHRVFTADPDATTVNKVRHHVEEQLGLGEGFFASDEWKQRSKALIKECVGKLLDGWVPETDKDKEPSKPKNGAKRQSQAPREHDNKRQRRASQPKPAEGGHERDHDEPKHAPKPAPRRKAKAAASDEDDDLSSPPEEESESKDHAGRDKEASGRSSANAAAPKDESDDAESSINVEEAKPSVAEEEEYSDVIDERPRPPKRKKKDHKEAPPRPRAATKKSAAAKASSPDDPDDAEIKKLQGQLVKCGVRKLWHNELKKYGDDARAKIRHLKRMLADLGMDGRFSEAKAREIRETRELMAEAEAAQEMNRLWGMGGGGRASRSKSKSTKLEETPESDGGGGGGGDGGDEEDDEEDDDERDTFAARRRRAQADLAFLGDDSDSD